MSACTTVNRWITENVLVPVEKFITEAKRVCEEAKRKIEEQVEQPVEDWVTKEEERCKKQKCKWWCACCNKWFCWIVVVVVKVITWIVVTIVKWVTYLVCKIVTVVVGAIVELVLKIITRLVTFFVCLFTDPLRALSALWDLFNDIVDFVDDLFELVVDLLGDIRDILLEIADFLEDLGETFCIFGDVACSIFTAIFGILKGLVEWVADIVDWIRDTIEGLRDLIIGILSLDWCRIQKGLGIFNVLRVITSVTRLIGQVFVVGIGDQIRRRNLNDMIDGKLAEAYADDTTALAQARKLVGVGGGNLLGAPVTLQPYRMAIRSTDFLRDLHKEGIINLNALAGRFTNCQGKAAWSQITGELVYTGTDTTVTKTDIDTFLREGPDAVASFTAYPITYPDLLDRLELTQLKFEQVGVRATWNQIDELVIRDARFVPLQQAAQPDLLTLVGRTGFDGERGDDLSKIPYIAHFTYDDPGLHGLASWFRPRRKALGPSGITFRDRWPAVVMKYVPVHEVGHYLGLDHEGHTSPAEIMWKPALGTDWGETLANYLLTTGSANFTPTDSENVWDWITTTDLARESILV